jgi:CheY-like chemotaxis protein
MTPSSANLAGLRVLVVEDEMLVAMMIEDMLAEFGCIVVGAASRVGQALKLLEEADEIDGAVLDVNLAGEKVFPVAEALDARGIPFVFSTGYGTAGLPDHFRNRLTLQKPYRPEDLEGALAAALTPKPQ